MLKKQQKPPGFLHSNKVSPQRSYIFLLRKLLLLRVNFTNLPLGLLKIFFLVKENLNSLRVHFTCDRNTLNQVWWWNPQGHNQDFGQNERLTVMRYSLGWLTNGLFRLFSNTSFRKVFSNGNIAKKPKITASRGNYLEGQHSS